MNLSNSNGISLTVLLGLVVVLCGVFELAHCFEENDAVIKMKPGGVHECKGSQNSAEIDGLARFAVQEHNKKEVIFVITFISFFLGFV